MFYNNKRVKAKRKSMNPVQYKPMPKKLPNKITCLTLWGHFT
ncbi:MULTISPECIES: IS3 family transposase [Bacillus]